MEDIKLGDRVKPIGKDVNGKITFIGETHFSGGLWCGLTLDEPIGRHDGVVEGKRYFKCPRNHGMFIRATHIEKVSQENTNDKDAVSNKSTHQNYSKSRPKLKSEKNVSYKDGDYIFTTEAENTEKKTPERFHESPINSNYLKPEHKLKWDNTVSTRRNVENMRKTGKEIAEKKIPEIHESPKGGELQKIKEENDELKAKLKNTEDTLHDTLEKYTKMIDENKSLLKELDNKKKRIRIQRDHLKLLKMRQCNHFEEKGSPKPSCQKSNPSSPKEGGDQTNVITHVESQTLSDEEFDLETTKSLSCTQRVVELEEQIRIMKQGLIQLKEFLTCHSPPSFVAVLESANGRDKQNTNRSLAKEDAAHSNLTLGLERAKTTSALKEYYNMLCEITNYSHIDEANGIAISGYKNPLGEKNDKGENNIQQFRHQTSDQIAPCVVAENCVELPRTSKESVTSHIKHIPDEGDKQDTFQRDSKQHSGRPLNITLQVRKNSQNRHLTNRKSPIKVSDPVNELKHLMPTAQNRHSTSSSSLTHRKVVIEDVSDSVSNSSLLKSDSNAELSLTSLEKYPVLPYKSSGGGDASIASRGKTPQERMQFSTRKLHTDKIRKNSANKKE